MKTKKIISLLLALALCLGLMSGCGGNGGEDKDTTAETRTVTDWLGREVEIPQTVERVVCVNVSSLRYTTYMDALDLIVGVEENEIGATCQKPFSYLHQDLFETLPQTGNNGETYDEEIIACDPQVIVAYLDAETADALSAKTGVPVVTIPNLEGILDDEVYATIKLLGEVYGKQDRAEELTTYLDSIKKDIADRIASVPEDERPTVYVSGVSYKGSHGFEGTEAGYGPLAELGAVNIADSTGKTTPFDMDLEEVLRLDPDYIFVDTSGLELINEQYAQNPDYFNSLSAVKNGNVYSQISFRYNATNTELALADMYYMATVLYPEAFADVDPVEKANEIFETFLGVENYYSVLEAGGLSFTQITIGD